MNSIGKKIIRLESVDSTNNYAANVIRNGKAEHGTVILAVEQYAGKGQRNAQWLAAPGENLTFSLIWDEVNLSVDQQFDITRFISLAMVELLRRYAIDVEIKWPNDILFEGKKIAGILIENQIQGMLIRRSVIGIGLNVNQNHFDGLNAISMALIKGRKYVTDDVLFSFCEVLNHMTKDGRSIPLGLQESYLNKLYCLNREAVYQTSSGVEFNGIITGVDRNGRLEVDNNGEIVAYDLKDIRFISQNS